MNRAEVEMNGPLVERQHMPLIIPDVPPNIGLIGRIFVICQEHRWKISTLTGCAVSFRRARDRAQQETRIECIGGGGEQ